ncbi:MAG: hypothetical protein DI536_33180 [Archangium gephyra]|uniref:Neutral ceramidase n=1 Tax=Archangium gephyra TaxID=48 RepID=A0A2W5SW60_9BACT|nr:MAG: hypothetical protein DI536_33180 [Archangium gephyra]
MSNERQFITRAAPVRQTNTGSKVGVAVRELPFVQHAILAGWGFIHGQRVRKACAEDMPLKVRCMVLQAVDGARIALVTVDLHGGSRYLTETVAAFDEVARLGISVDRLFLFGTHNHSGPGGLYGSVYDTLTASTAVLGAVPLMPDGKLALNTGLATRIAELIRDCIVEAGTQRLVDAKLGFACGHLPDTENRSSAAFLNNFENADDARRSMARHLGVAVDSLPEDAVRMAVDPRVWTLAAVTAGGEVIGTFSTVNCHNTVLSRDHDVQSPDFFGHAADRLERAGNGVCLIAAGSIGDTDPLLKGDLDERRAERAAARDGKARLDQNLKLICAHADAVANAVTSVLATARSNASPLAALEVRYSEEPIAGQRIDDYVMPLKPCFGESTLAGSELGRGPPLFVEGIRSVFDDGDPHSPKHMADSAIAAVLLGAANDRLQRLHTFMPLRLATLRTEANEMTRIVSLPGECTTWLSARLERAVKGSASRVLVTSVTGDYLGYLTTAREYAVQNYEGSSTIWGRHTGRWLQRRLEEMAFTGAAPRLRPTAEFFTDVEDEWETAFNSAKDRGVWRRRDDHAHQVPTGSVDVREIGQYCDGRPGNAEPNPTQRCEAAK